MDHIKYTGNYRFKTEPATDKLSCLQAEHTSDSLLINNLNISTALLVKFEHKDFILIVDGVIYEYDNKSFTDDLYPHLIDGFTNSIENTLQLIRGEFVLILCKLSSRKTWILTSESGNAAFFFKKSEHSLHFSNSLSDLARTGSEKQEIYFQRIFDVLTANKLGSHHTCFSEIKKLLPGHIMEVHEGGMRIFKYSSLFSNPKLEVNSNPYERFRELFTNAVSCRMDSNKIGIALSSGKDSTSVAAMACALQLKSGQQVTGYTYKPYLLDEKHLGNIKFNETLLLGSFLKSYPKLISKLIEPGKGTVIHSLERSIEIFGEPIYGASNQFWIQAMHEMMKTDQCGIMLTGQGGNFTISWPPPELVTTNRSFMQSLKRRLKPFFHHAPRLPYLTNDFLKSISQDHFIDHQPHKNLHQLQSNLMKNSISYTGYLQKQVSLFHGLHVSDPTVDKHLIQYCLSLPYTVYHDKYSSRKLVTSGLKDMLPKDIRENSVRGVQAADIQLRIQMEKDLILEKLRFLNKKNLVTFVIEIGKLEKDFRSMDVMSMSRKEVNYLLRLLLIGIFLSKIK